MTDIVLIGGFFVVRGVEKGVMELLTPDETAQFLKVNVRSVYEMSRHRSQVRSKHPIPVIRLHGKCLRFSKEALENWVNQIAKTSMSN